MSLYILALPEGYFGLVPPAQAPIIISLEPEMSTAVPVDFLTCLF